MKLLEKIGNTVVRKTVLAAGLMAGFLAFLGAGTASARPRVYVGIGGPVVVHGYYGPYRAPRPYWGPAYVAPGYSYGYYYHGPRHRYWDARFGCWRYR
jgi:hypothetical protein